VNIEPVVEAGVRVTTVPVLKLALQVAPQLMPAGELATEPVPVPARLTVRVCCVGGGGGVPPLKVAVTLFEALIVSMHERAPVQAPLQPPNVEPVLARAVRVTLLFNPKVELHVAPQLMPVGELVTTPLPVPAGVTVTVGAPAGGVVSKLAETLVAAFIATTQDPVPLQAPPQPVKVDPLVAAAASVTEVAVV
jgi:hypothetical protein